ncbi:MAG: protein containing prepilin-type N- cleavage/methylation domain protein, partial [Epsilonproteobacteria bacterium]|nr:protein containing prepilin-type N- cleavage/methylation domain protein [Campylobacterota bacterium]
NSMIDTLSNGTASLSNAVLFFLGSEIDVTNGFGWSGALVDQTQTLHPIQAGINANEFSSSNADDFSGIDVYEFYQLAWSAYALAYENGSLFLYYNYQPWEGETYKDGSKELMMERVSTFRFMAIGDIIKIQLCVKSELTSEEYSICKEKTVF